MLRKIVQSTLLENINKKNTEYASLKNSHHTFSNIYHEMVSNSCPSDLLYLYIKPISALQMFICL